MIYRGAIPNLNGNPIEITDERTDGDGNHTYLTPLGWCTGEFAAYGTARILVLRLAEASK